MPTKRSTAAQRKANIKRQKAYKKSVSDRNKINRRRGQQNRKA